MALPAEQRSVQARWDGGMRAVVTAGRFEIVVDEPETSGGADTGPQPTDYLLTSAASCFTLAMAWVAAKRGLELPGLAVRATGTYEGMRFAHIAMAVIADVPPGVLEGLIPHAERVCYVTNTLRHSPQLEVSVGSTDEARTGGENAP